MPEVAVSISVRVRKRWIQREVFAISADALASSYRVSRTNVREHALFPSMYYREGGLSLEELALLTPRGAQSYRRTVVIETLQQVAFTCMHVLYNASNCGWGVFLTCDRCRTSFLAKVRLNVLIYRVSLRAVRCGAARRGARSLQPLRPTQVAWLVLYVCMIHPRPPLVAALHAPSAFIGVVF